MKIIAASGSQVTLEFTEFDVRTLKEVLYNVSTGFGFPFDGSPLALGVEHPVVCALLDRMSQILTLRPTPLSATFTNPELTILRIALQEVYRVLYIKYHDELITLMSIDDDKLAALHAVVTNLLETMSQLATQEEADSHSLDRPDPSFAPVLQSIETYEQTPRCRERGGFLTDGQYKLFTTIKPGTLLKGTVSKLRDSGVFVAVDGLNRWIPKGEIAWSPVNHPGDILHIGQEVEVKVVSVDTEHSLLTYSLKTEP